MTTMMAEPARKVATHEQRITSVADIVRGRLPSYGKRPAIRYDDGNTYQTLNFIDYVGNIGRALQVVNSVESQQQIICTFVQNRPEWDMLALASLYTGNILFPLDTKMNDKELTHLLMQSPPDVVLVSPSSRGRMNVILKQLGISARILIADLYSVFEDTHAPTIGDLRDHEQRLSSLPFPRPPGRHRRSLQERPASPGSECSRRRRAARRRGRSGPPTRRA